MVSNIHRPNLYRVFVSIMGKRLNGKNRDIRSDIKNYGFVQNFLSILRRDTAKRNEHSNQLIIIRTHEAIYLCMILCGTIREFDFYIIRSRQTITTLAGFPFAGINIFFGIRLSDFSGKLNQKFAPGLRLFRHIDSRKELRTLIVIRAAPAADTILA